MRGGVELRLLGPVEVLVGGEPVALSRQQVRQVLSLLAVANGAIVTIDELIHEIFREELPQAPRQVIYTSVSRARGVLGEAGGLLEKIGDGYRLIGVTTDLQIFDELVARASTEAPAVAVDTLEAALALRRGAAFGVTGGSPTLDEAADAIEVRRREAAATLVDLLVEIGAHQRAVDLGEPMVDADPTWEQVTASVARAQVALGRRREALVSLERLRGELRTVLGITPSVALQELEQAILSGAVDLVPAPARPVEDTEWFVGRRRELARLAAAVEAGVPAVVIGEPGIGKSSLLRRLVAGLADRSGLVVEVDPEPTRPLALVADLVAGLLEAGASPPDDETARSALARVVPDLEADHGGLSREELARSLAMWLASAIAQTGTVVVIDDFHLVDPFSADVLGQVVMAGVGPILAAARPTDDPTVVGLLGRGLGFRELALRPLSTLAVAAYVEERSVRGGAELVADLHERSGGNPLFLSLLVDLQVEGALGTDALPPSLKVAVHDRLGSLSDRAVRTLQFAAAIGRRFSVDALELVLPAARPDLGAASSAGLVTIDGNDGAFAHGLVAETCYEMMPSGLAVAVHDQLGTALAAAGAGAPDYASHFVAAAGLDPGRALDACSDAGAAFAEGSDIERSLAHLEAGLRLVDSHNLSASRRAGIRLQLGRTQRVFGVDGHVAMLIAAIDDAESVGDTDLAATALVELVSHGGTTEAGRTDEDLLVRVERTLAWTLPDPIRADLLAATSTLVALSADVETGQRYYREAVALAESLDQPEIERRVLARAHLGFSHPDDFERRAAAASRLVRLAGDDVDLQWEAAYLTFWQAFVAGDGRRLAHCLTQMRTLAPRAVHRRVSMRHLETTYLHVTGDLDGAEAALEIAFAEAREIYPESWAFAHYSGLLFAIRKSQSRLEELAPMTDSFTSAFDDFPNWRIGSAYVALETGDESRARELIDSLAADDFAALTPDLTWSAAMSGLGDIAATCGPDLMCDAVYDRLLPHRNRLSWAGTCTFGPVDDSLAALADRRGDATAAAEHRRSADGLRAGLRAEVDLA